MQLALIVEKQPAEEIIAQFRPIFCDDSAYLVISLLRHLTAYEMLAHPEHYGTFLPALEGLARVPGPTPPPLAAVVDALVLQEGVDAEHVMMQALSTALQLPLGVVYAAAGTPVRVCCRLTSAVFAGLCALVRARPYPLLSLSLYLLLCWLVLYLLLCLLLCLLLYLFALTAGFVSRRCS